MPEFSLETVWFGDINWGIVSRDIVDGALRKYCRVPVVIEHLILRVLCQTRSTSRIKQAEAQAAGNAPGGGRLSLGQRHRRPPEPRGSPHPPAHRLVPGLPGGALRRQRPGRELRPQSLAGGRPRRCAPGLLAPRVPAPATPGRALPPPRSPQSLPPACSPPSHRTSPSVTSLALFFLFVF